MILGHGHRRNRTRDRNVRPVVGADRRDRPDMTLVVASMGAADVFGLVVSVLVCAYLLYALLRGEKF
jgi:K+-transporting ATPase KdpF subunit